MWHFEKVTDLRSGTSDLGDVGQVTSHLDVFFLVTSGLGEIVSEVLAPLPSVPPSVMQALSLAGAGMEKDSLCRLWHSPTPRLQIGLTWPAQFGSSFPAK